jgi:hypothetical protein
MRSTWFSGEIVEAIFVPKMVHCDKLSKVKEKFIAWPGAGAAAVEVR